MTDLWAEALGGFGTTGYAVRLSAETVVGNKERSAGNPSPDILSLRGRRLALFSEQAGDKPINPERMKDLTGGDSLTARAPHRNPITFRPTHTLIGCGNHKPLIHGSDYAIWRRMMIVPFQRQFKPSRLSEELREQNHMAAILRWMVEGAMKLRECGWMTPRVVEQACRDYQTEADLLRQWIEDRCVVDPGSETPSGDLFHAYDYWCAENKEMRLGHSAFTRRMLHIGFRRRKSNSQVFLQGIRLRDLRDVAAPPEPEGLA